MFELNGFTDLHCTHDHWIVKYRLYLFVIAKHLVSKFEKKIWIADNFFKSLFVRTINVNDFLNNYFRNTPHLISYFIFMYEIIFSKY